MRKDREGNNADGTARPSSGRRGMRLPKASDVLANELRAKILEDDLQPGDDLPSETQLIEEHRFSRGTVREALRLLESDGFVSIQRGPKGGISVDHPDAQTVSRSLATLLTLDRTPLSNLFEFRKLIEPAAAGRAAIEASDEQRKLLAEMTDPAYPDRGAAEFHTILGECTKNELFRVMLAALNRVVEWHAGMETVSETDLTEAGHAHERIARAIIDGDAEGASAFMLKHLAAFEDVMRDQGRLSEPILPRPRWVAYLRQTVPQQ